MQHRLPARHTTLFAIAGKQRGKKNSYVDTVSTQPIKYAFQGEKMEASCKSVTPNRANKNTARQTDGVTILLAHFSEKKISQTNRKSILLCICCVQIFLLLSAGPRHLFIKMNEERDGHKTATWSSCFYM